MPFVAVGSHDSQAYLSITCRPDLIGSLASKSSCRDCKLPALVVLIPSENIISGEFMIINSTSRTPLTHLLKEDPLIGQPVVKTSL